MLETFPWSKLITMLFSVVALILSGWGLHFAFTANSLSKKSNALSVEANETSNKAFELSEKSFEIETRPFLNIDFRKQKEDSLYYTIKSEGQQLLYLFTIRMTNVGKTPASNISIPQTGKVGFLNVNGNLNIDFPSDLVLGPGQSYEVDITIVAELATKPTKEEVEKRREKGAPVLITFSVNYGNFTDSDKQYKSKIKYKVAPNMVSYLEGGEMI